TQNIIHTVAAAQVLQSGQRFGVGHARLNFRKTVEGMFEFTSKKLSESTVLWSTALTLHPTSRTGSARTPSGRYFSFELLLHRGNGKYRQLPQPPNKCFPIAAPLVVFAPLCHPHQDVEYLLYSEPLRRPSDLSRFLDRSQTSREPIFALRIQMSYPRP